MDEHDHCIHTLRSLASEANLHFLLCVPTHLTLSGQILVSLSLLAGSQKMKKMPLHQIPHCRFTRHSWVMQCQLIVEKSKC